MLIPGHSLGTPYRFLESVILEGVILRVLLRALTPDMPESFVVDNGVLFGKLYVASLKHTIVSMQLVSLAQFASFAPPFTILS